MLELKRFSRMVTLEQTAWRLEGPFLEFANLFSKIEIMFCLNNVDVRYSLNWPIAAT